MNFTLNIWRQKDSNSAGKFVAYTIENISENDSFLEMLDALNETLIQKGEEIVAFDYDCREGICGSCGLVINGYPHGEQKATTTCQLYMRKYKQYNELWIEPFRSAAFVIVKDLIVDRSSLDNIIIAGGYVSTKTGNASSANAMLVAKENADSAFGSAECIGCGACVAVCPNGSASLFLSAKLNHLNQLPQGQVEHKSRTASMLQAMNDNNLGSCSNHKHCADVCPKGITLENIQNMHKSVLFDS